MTEQDNFPKKKEVTVDFLTYQNELNDALNKGVNAGYQQALNGVIRYLKEGKEAKDIFKGEINPLWQYVLEALGKGDEWKSYVEMIAEQEKAQDKQEISDS